MTDKWQIKWLIPIKLISHRYTQPPQILNIFYLNRENYKWIHTPKRLEWKGEMGDFWVVCEMWRPGLGEWGTQEEGGEGRQKPLDQWSLIHLGITHSESFGHINLFIYSIQNQSVLCGHMTSWKQNQALHFEGENGKRFLGDQYNSPPAHNAFGKELIQKNPFSYAQNGQDWLWRDWSASVHLLMIFIASWHLLEASVKKSHPSYL